MKSSKNIVAASEHDGQCALMDWWAKQWPKYYECLFSIPNGSYLAGNEKQRKIQMNYLKAEGLKPGVSDLFLMVARSGYHGLFIEMKCRDKKKAKVSEPQKEHILRAREQGYMAEVCYGFDEAQKLIHRYMRS